MFGLRDKRFLQFIESEFMVYKTLVSNLEKELQANMVIPIDDHKKSTALLTNLIEAKKAFEIISEFAYKYKILHNIEFSSSSMKNYFSK